MILIIAEKPSLGRNIASALGSFRKRNGFLENERYLITWAFGHLFSLADIEYYKPKQSKYWSMENIPCFPERFVFQLRKEKNGNGDDGILRQFQVIESLCNREDVTDIVNAGDSDREGEIIIRTCITQALHTKKTIRRLWLPDQTEETVREAVNAMELDEKYDSLAHEGYARTYIDWLYGVNLTRYASIKSGKLLRVGRVIVPVVKAIYDRDMQIRTFQPEPYYVLVSKAATNGEVIELASKHKFSKNEKNDALRACTAYNNADAFVETIKRKKDTLNAGKLYSLTKLQNVLGKKYKMPMEESLRILQGLYEKGYVTYPRTNSEYLATKEQDKIKKIISAVESLGYPVAFCFKKTIFDDKKIEAHSALTPTVKIPKREHLTQEEYNVYSTIVRRFVAVFCAEPCECEKNEITIRVGDLESFSLKGSVITKPGWTKYDDYGKKDKFLPQLTEGQKIATKFEVTQKETTPPKHYTIETLNNYLKNPFREEKANVTEDDDEEYKAMFDGLELGTEATRTGIIDNAIKSGYILLKKDTYTILKDGEFLIEFLSNLNIGMDKFKTAQLGKALKQVYRGEITVHDSVMLAETEIKEVFSESSRQSDYGSVGDAAGLCPLCGKNVLRTPFGYGCSGYRDGCKFSVNGLICKRLLGIGEVKQLLQTGTTDLLDGFCSLKTGKSFQAKLVLENGKVKFSFT